MAIERNEHAADILDSWASAIRGDWSEIDGRSCEAQLTQISRYLRGTKGELTESDVAVHDGHWRWNCRWMHGED